MILNDYTKKIIRRLAVVFALAGAGYVVAGVYAQSGIFLFAGAMMLLAAHTGYGIGKSK